MIWLPTYFLIRELLKAVIRKFLIPWSYLNIKWISKFFERENLDISKWKEVIFLFICCLFLCPLIPNKRKINSRNSNLLPENYAVSRNHSCIRFCWSVYILIFTFIKFGNYSFMIYFSEEKLNIWKKCHSFKYLMSWREIPRFYKIHVKNSLSGI